MSKIIDSIEVDGFVMKPRTCFHVGASRDRWRCLWIEKVRGKPWVIAYGPVGSEKAKSGVPFYAGPAPLTRRSKVTGKDEKIKPARFRLAADQKG